MFSIRIAGGWFFAMRRVLATICIGLLAVFIGYKVVFGANGMKVWEGKRAEIEKLQREIEVGTTVHDQLQHHVDLLQREDRSTIEKEAREQLGFVRPGEQVLYEQPPKLDAKLPPAVTESMAAKATPK
jgi:cell division protein FtsB